MSVVRLSICMPTYNFGKFIGASLESIVKQMEDGVEIIILDGGSTDNTAEVVRQFRSLHSNIVYVRQEYRGGIDRDMAKAVELASGPYCWLFSSDDVMRDGALKKVLTEIETGLDLYLCGLNLCTLNMTLLRQHRILDIGYDANFDLHKSKDRHRYCELAETTTAFFSFMGSLIFKKVRWCEIPFDEAFDGSLWAHVARFFRMIPAGLSMRYLAEPYLDKRGDNDSFMDKGLIHRCKMAIDGYDRLASTFFHKDSTEAIHIRRVVRNELPPLTGFLRWRYATWSSGNPEELKLLDGLCEQVFVDATVLNGIRRFIYNNLPMSWLKLFRTVYKSVKLSLSRSV